MKNSKVVPGMSEREGEITNHHQCRGKGGARRFDYYPCGVVRVLELEEGVCDLADEVTADAEES